MGKTRLHGPTPELILGLSIDPLEEFILGPCRQMSHTLVLLNLIWTCSRRTIIPGTVAQLLHIRIDLLSSLLVPLVIGVNVVHW
jgi:hypothetical protein